MATPEAFGKGLHRDNRAGATLERRRIVFCVTQHC
jgi:hypothetical protein